MTRLIGTTILLNRLTTHSSVQNQPLPTRVHDFNPADILQHVVIANRQHIFTRCIAFRCFIPYAAVLRTDESYKTYRTWALFRRSFTVLQCSFVIQPVQILHNPTNIAYTSSRNERGVRGCHKIVVARRAICASTIILFCRVAVARSSAVTKRRKRVHNHAIHLFVHVCCTSKYRRVCNPISTRDTALSHAAKYVTRYIQC
jgi:hypothetical protein